MVVGNGIYACELLGNDYREIWIGYYTNNPEHYKFTELCIDTSL
jgi:hypothetical protein